jgi:peptidylprolyl isomerase
MKRFALGCVAGLLGLVFPAWAKAEIEAAGWTATAPAAGVPDEATWRAVDPARLFIFETTKGRILIEAFPEVAPKHFAQFTAVIRSGDLNGTAFHRVIDDFMAQGGDVGALKKVEDTGWKGIPAEFTFRRDPGTMPLQASVGPSDTSKTGYFNGFPLITQPSFFFDMSLDGRVESALPHCRGILSTARTADNVNSGDTQFFLMREHSPFLDKNYTAWGRVIEGQDVVKAIKHSPDPRGGIVTDPDVLTSAMIAADLPEAKRPAAYVLRTDTAAFAAELAAKGDVDICTLPPIPSIIR